MGLYGCFPEVGMRVFPGPGGGGGGVPIRSILVFGGSMLGSPYFGTLPDVDEATFFEFCSPRI